MQSKSLKYTNIILLVCAIGCLVCYDIFGGLWLKGVTSSWFVLLGAVNLWCARKLEWKRLRFFLLMEAGLFCGMCADVLLGVVFFAGIGVFALGHVLYLVAFYTLEKFSRRDLWIIAPLAAISISLGACFQALGNGIYSTIVSICRQMLVLLPVAWLMSLTGEVNNVWWAFPIAEVISASTTLLLFARIYKAKIKPLFQ